jgi:hypothetical protein
MQDVTITITIRDSEWRCDLKPELNFFELTKVMLQTLKVAAMRAGVARGSFVEVLHGFANHCDQEELWAAQDDAIRSAKP